MINTSEYGPSIVILNAMDTSSTKYSISGPNAITPLSSVISVRSGIYSHHTKMKKNLVTIYSGGSINKKTTFNLNVQKRLYFHSMNTIA